MEITEEQCTYKKTKIQHDNQQNTIPEKKYTERKSNTQAWPFGHKQPSSKEGKKLHWRQTTDIAMKRHGPADTENARNHTDTQAK
jgi:hypothetical protein